MVLPGTGQDEPEEYLNTQLKAVRLWAVCPAEVEVVAPPSEPRVMLLAGSVGMEVRDIAFRSPVGGIVVSDVTDVLCDGHWGSSRDIYIGDSETIDLAPALDKPDQNSSEQTGRLMQWHASNKPT
ncbi:MAG: hypothetical protein DRI90_02990 [Deltaproteobacteria bacterium]|nr:MAG: hypothetical protein DRI90_02990 [Deltaproteobacteria bacterium]